VEQPPLAASVCEAARRAFDLPSDLELVLQDHDGRELSEEAALSEVVAHAETIYAIVPDTALHDFERRVDQLEHMRIGYVCDQLASFREAFAALRASLSSVRDALEQEQAVRQSGNDALRQGTEALSLEMDSRLNEIRNRLPQMQQEQNRHLERLHAVEVSILDIRQGLQEEASPRALGANLHETQRQSDKLREAMKDQSQALGLTEKRLNRELEDTRTAMQREVKHREDREASLERTLADTRRSLDETSATTQAAASRVEAQEASLQSSLNDMRKAIYELNASSRDAMANVQAMMEARLEALEVAGRSPRTENSADAKLTVQVPEYSAEIAKLASRCSTQEKAFEDERIVRQQVSSELTQQLSVAVESIQEEQVLRSTEDAELRRLIEGFRSSMEEVRHRQEELEFQVPRSTRDLTTRLDAETSARSNETSKLHRLLSEERDARQESIAQAVQRFEHSLGNSKAEEREQANAIEELSEKLSQVRARIGEQHLPQATAWVREIRELVDAERTARVTDMKILSGRIDGCEAHGAEVSQNVASALAQCLHNVAAEQKSRAAFDSEVRSWLDHEAKAREEGDLTLSHSVQKAGEALEEALRRQEDIDGKLQEDKVTSSEPSSELTALKEGMAKVVEAVQQERRYRTESDTQLRDDCCEAIQKEIRARLEGETKLKEDLKIEARTREEVLRATDLAIAECNVSIAECKRELETHTHELRVAPEETPQHGNKDGPADLPTSTSRESTATSTQQLTFLPAPPNIELGTLLPAWSPGVVMGGGMLEPIRRV
jgi:chromosome segregation ATPase